MVQAGDHDDAEDAAMSLEAEVMALQIPEASTADGVVIDLQTARQRRQG
jgi:hypothetical protein